MHRIAPLLALALILGSIPAFAQSASDYEALEKQIEALQTKVDKLQREQAESTVSYSGSAAAAKDIIEQNKLLLAADVTEMKLFGDLRFRYQGDEFHPLVDVPAQATDNRNRWRFRLRIGADIQLGDQFFAGVTLATGQAADSNNQTYTEGYDNYNIYIDKAFAGWAPNDWFTIVLGKQANPLYTTQLVWDPNITPQGASETFDLSKAFLPENSPLSLRFTALQGAFYGGGSFTAGSDTAWQFVEQLKGTWHFNKDVSLTFAPGFMTYTAASLTGLQNSVNFSKTTDTLPAAASVQVQSTTTTTNTQTVKYSSTGVPTVTVTPVNTTTTVTTTSPATGSPRTVTTTTVSNQVQQTVPTTLPTNPALANKTFVSTTTSGGGTVTVKTPVGAAPAQETRDLAILTAPGDVSFKIGGLATKVYWDFAYNTEGAHRATNEYFLAHHSSEDDYAWLVGLQLGTNAHTGDWSLDANFRRVGMDAIDPNLNESNFALSSLNVQGFEVSVAYNFTDYLVGAITDYYAWRFDHSITGGEATAGATLANARKVNVLQVDLNLKF
jgi:predicted porin